MEGDGEKPKWSGGEVVEVIVEWFGDGACVVGGCGGGGREE